MGPRRAIDLSGYHQRLQENSAVSTSADLTDFFIATVRSVEKDVMLKHR